MGDSNKFYPALSITNVKALFPITLDLDSSQYNSWAALFKVQARVHDVLDHVIPPTDIADKAASDKAKSENPTLWKRLDVVVLQWIYSTLSSDILHSILVDDDSAAQAWIRVADLFHDNKNSRAMYLNKEFTNTMLSDFSSTNAYCNRLKSLADQLNNVGSLVSDNGMVLKMLQGLTEQYSNFVTVMQQKKNLPSFTAARSKLALEETTIGERSKQEASSIALSASDDGSTDGASPFPVSQPGRGQQSRGRNGGNKHRNKNSGGNGSGRGQNGQSNWGGRGGNRGGGSSSGGQQRPLTGQSWQQPPWWMMMQQPWTSPPCQYPTQAWGQSWARYPRPPTTGVLGPRPSGPQHDQPQQAFAATQQWAPTDIEAAMHTMSLSQPDQNWYMDTGATSHMTAAQGGELPPEM